MKREVKIEIDEVKRVFYLLEEMNDLFHQKMKYGDSEYVETFAKKHNAEISQLYYETVWNWLPKDIQDEIVDQ